MNSAFLIHSNFVTIIPTGGQPTTIDRNDIRFSSVLSAIKAKNWIELENILTLPKAIAKFSAGKINVYDSIITYAGKEIKGTIADRIFEFIREGFPFESLVKFLNKLMENPSENSRNQIYQFMEANKLPISEDGDVLFFKVVTPELKDCHTREIDNSIGQIVKMDRDLVSDDPNSACSSGLHCAAWAYCESFGSNNSVIILVKVNPKNIVSVPHDADAKKVRVCEYEVVKIVGGKAKVIDFQTNFAPQNEVSSDIEDVEDDYICKREHEDANQSFKIYGNNAAYQLHKEGETLTNQRGLIIKPEDNKPRWYFRANKGLGWVIYIAEVKNVAEKKTGDKKYIGANKAYEIVKNGGKVMSNEYLNNFIVDCATPRSFFRRYSNWQVV